MVWTEVVMIIGAVAAPVVLTEVLVERAARRSRRGRGSFDRLR